MLVTQSPEIEVDSGLYVASSVCSPAKRLAAWSAGCFTKLRNYRQISTGNIYFFDRGVPLSRDLFLRCALCSEGFSAEEQLRIFRLRFTPLKMTTVFLYQVASPHGPEFKMTAVFLYQAASVWTSSGVGLSFIYGAPFGVNYLQSGRIYFDAAQCDVRRPLANCHG